MAAVLQSSSLRLAIPNPNPNSNPNPKLSFSSSSSSVGWKKSSNSSNRSSSSRRRLAFASSPSAKAKYIYDDYLVKKVSAKEVAELIKGERSVPVVLDFYATWCGPCILMAQELEMLAVEYEKNALFLKVDTDDEYEFARDMQVRGLPTLYFISPDPNKDAIRTEGLVPPEMIKDIIDNEL